jgi:hypothetical protein
MEPNEDVAYLIVTSIQWDIFSTSCVSRAFYAAAKRFQRELAGCRPTVRLRTYYEQGTIVRMQLTIDRFCGSAEIFHRSYQIEKHRVRVVGYKDLAGVIPAVEFQGNIDKFLRQIHRSISGLKVCAGATMDDGKSIHHSTFGPDYRTMLISGGNLYRGAFAAEK